MSGNTHNTQPAELPATSSAPAQQTEHFPPPPPGPPPSHAQDSKADHYPPPPPGPPPGHAAQSQHTNETPIPDYNIPAYNPSNPQFAPPPTKLDGDDASLYDEPPPPKPHAAAATGAEGSSDASGAAAAGKSSWTSKFSGWGTKAAAPFNMLANKLGSEAFLPTTMDKECEKAARILRSFCKDGIYTDVAPVPEGQAEKPAPPPSADAPALSAAPTTAIGAAMAANAANAVNEANAGSSGTVAKQPQKPKSRTLLTIPSKVISRAAGLAIFTTARAGFHVSGATGSGIIVARLPDGRWSPPSGITVHSVGAGLMIGLDIYDCVVVINTPEALKAFTSTRVSLGTDLAVAAGPWGAGGAVDFAAPSRDRSKSREGRGKEAEEVRPTLPPRPVSTERPADQKPATMAAPQVTTGVDSGPTAAASTPGAAAPPIVPDAETTTGAGRPTAGTERKPSALKTAITKPVYSYVKSRGFYAGVQVDGTVFAERKDANAAFYGKPVNVEQILHGDVPAQGPAGQGWPHGVQGLFEVLRGAEGWRGQQQGQQQQNLGVPGATAGIRDLNLDGAGGHGPAAGGAPHATPAAQGKAAEAAAEARAHPDPATSAGPPPPVYSEPTGAGAGAGGASEDLPPAYVDDGQARPAAGDVKSGHH